MTAKRPSARIQRAGDVAARAQVLDDGVAGHLARVRGVAVLLASRAARCRRERCRCRCAAGAPACAPGPCASARAASGSSLATSRRTSTSRRSPASSRVEPRGSSASSPRTISETSASRGRPRSRRRAPAAASPGRITCSTTSAPSSRTAPTSRIEAGARGSSDVTPSRRATGVDRRALQQRREQHREEDDVEERLGLRRRPSITGKIASTTGTAPRRPGPAEQRLLAHAEAAARACASDASRAGARRRRPRARAACPRHATSSEVGGEHEQAEREEHRQLRDPGQALVERGHGALGRDVRPSPAPARPGRRRGSPSRRACRRRRTRAPRWRATRPGRGPGLESRTRQERPRRQPADRDAGDEADARAAAANSPSMSASP